MDGEEEPPANKTSGGSTSDILGTSTSQDEADATTATKGETQQPEGDGGNAEDKDIGVRKTGRDVHQFLRGDSNSKDEDDNVGDGIAPIEEGR